MSAAPEAKAPLQMTGIGHRYGDTPVLDGVDLTVQSGEFVVLLGPSGCGKTTLLRAVAGLVTPQRGHIDIDGRRATEDGQARIATEHRGVGLVFQEYALFPHMTVAENVGYGHSSPNPARVNGMLELVGLVDLADRKPAMLSGGQQQRVAIARALAMEPEIILFDEPTSALDPELVGEVLKVIQTLAEEGRTMLMVTHEMGFARQVSSQVLFLHQGRVEEQGSAEILDHPNSERLQQFLSNRLK